MTHICVLLRVWYMRLFRYYHVVTRGPLFAFYRLTIETGFVTSTYTVKPETESG